MKHQCGTEMICVQDFCGNGTIQGSWKHQINFWADYCPVCKVTVFGGYWSNIPAFVGDEPDFDCLYDEIKAHIEKYEPDCEVAYQNYLKENDHE